MKIKSVRIKQFKRFTDLNIEDLPSTARMVVMVGPNGSGKSSLFEAFNLYLVRGKGGGFFDPTYHIKMPNLQTSNADSVLEASNLPPIPTDWSSLINNIDIEFHDVGNLDWRNPSLTLKKAFYIRSSYRNVADFVATLQKKADILEDQDRPPMLIAPEGRVSDNYQRLVANSISELYDEQSNYRTVKEVREYLIGAVREPLSRVLPQLELVGLGNPLEDGNFFFRKGDASNWRFKNLSGGEKAAFDLLLDFIIKVDKFDDTVFCIDEPETHMHTDVQGKLLQELFGLVPEQCQLWIATHSIGMMRKAKELNEAHPGAVVFLDFGSQDYDKQTHIVPSVTDRAFWKKTFSVAIGDLAELVAPQQILFCEGSRIGRRNSQFDAKCYRAIFSQEYPDTEFVSLGGVNEVENNSLLISPILEELFSSIAIGRVVDRDDRSEAEVSELLRDNTRVLTLRDIESYFFDDEILDRLCVQKGQSEKFHQVRVEKARLLSDSIARNNPSDDLKSISGPLYVKIKQLLGLTQCGNTVEAFCLDTLVPLLTSDTNVYKQLKNDLFGV